MKVIVLAVACAPYEGSEGKLGWEGILAISTFAEVHVLTAAHNEQGWIRARAENKVPDGITVHFLGIDRAWSSNRLLARGQSWLRYLTFLKEVNRILPELIRTTEPDLIHHLTYGTWRVPTEVWCHGLPVVWGPIGGAGKVPKAFRSNFSFKARLLEGVRSFHGWLVLRSRKFAKAVTKTDLILAADNETVELLEPYRGALPLETLPIAYLTPQKVAALQRNKEDRQRSEGTINIFAGGNIEGRKGVAWALQALKRVKAKGISFHYTIAGGGPEIPHLKLLTSKLGLEENVTFHPGYRGKEYYEKLKNTDIFLLPSFRESLGMTCQEAIVAGAYPLVADISAQGWLSRIAGIQGASVESEEALIADLTQAILRFAEAPEEMRRKANEGSAKISKYFSERRYIEITQKAYLAVGRS